MYNRGMANENTSKQRESKMSKLRTADEVYVIGLLNAALDKYVSARKTHDMLQCNASRDEMIQARRELCTMERIAYEATGDEFYKPYHEEN